MRLVVISHKICWTASNSPSGYATDGGFPVQMQTLAELFETTKIVVPIGKSVNNQGLVALAGNNLKICPLSFPNGEGWRRKLALTGWLFKNGAVIWREIKKADAVHAPIPGDVGTIGMVLALLLRKPLFVRYCGNWFVQKTTAEHLWRWSIERFAGGRNVMLATGGDAEPPSKRNPNVKWIFSTSLRKAEMVQALPRQLVTGNVLKLIIVCRQEKRKGTDLVIESLPLIHQKFPGATLNVVGDGSELEKLKELANKLGVENYVVFHGKVRQPKVINLLREADLFCYPTASEGFPKVVVEALACGLPVVTTPVSVLPMLLGSGCGRLLETTTRESVAETVSEICGDPVLYEQMSGAALETAGNYTLERWRDLINESLCEAWNVQSLSADYNENLVKPSNS